MLAMGREDFIDAPSAHLADAVVAEPPAPPRRVHGGWALMVAAGLIAAVANYAVLTADAPAAEVAVLTARAPAGTPVEALQLRRVALPVADPAAHRFAAPDDLAAMAGAVTATALDEGVVLRTGDLRDPAGATAGAMGLPIDPARAAGGLLQPGDRVDVIAGDPGAVDYVVRDVEVLGVSAPGGGVGQVGGGYALTLAVDPDEALALAEALRTGEVDVVRAAAASGGGAR
jgi:pilus assembly protein CpaB